MALRQQEVTNLCDDVDLDRDRALVERCQAGDSAAFGSLYARYYERLLRFCLRRLNDRHEAEDAAQEAFARAWKALPRFAGERRFYPWLTVIAGNICTDVVRRRSRSTPTSDMELTAQQPVGVVGADTSEELVLAAAEGELVHRALDRLSARHRHVLAMREGSGWTYQQIAEHEGVEIGTIETLLWRARQALKREFAFVSDSKEALAGFLIATGAFLRRRFFRVAHRGASVHSHGNGGTGGGLRNAMAGVAVTGAAVAAAFIAPHALSGPGPNSSKSGSGGGTGSALVDRPLSLGVPVPTATNAANPANGANEANAASSAGQPPTTNGSGGSGSSNGPLPGAGTSGGSGDNGTTGSGVVGGATGGSSPVSGTLNQAGQGIGNTVNGLTNGLGSTVNGLTNGLGNAVNGLTGGVGSGLSSTTSGVSNTAGSVVGGVSNTAGSVVGGVSNTVSGLLGGTGSGSGSTPAASSTTTTTAPSLLGGLGGLLGGN